MDMLNMKLFYKGSQFIYFFDVKVHNIEYYNIKLKILRKTLYYLQKT
jgi:hypothetical protein